MHKQCRFWLACFLAVCSWVALPARPALAGAPGKLYLFIVIDTRSDQKDDVIKDGQSWIKAFVKDIPRAHLKMEVLQGKEASRKGIEDYLAGIKPTSNDALVCVISCHGVTRKSDSDAHELGLNGNGLEVFRRSTLRKMLLAKNARLTVLISDACSEAPDNARARPPKRKDRVDVPPLLPDVEISAGYRKLFFETSGVVDINGSFEERAWSDSEMGGVFTRSICAVLKAVRDDGKIDWPTFYHKVRAGTRTNYKKWRELVQREYAFRRERLTQAEKRADELLNKQENQTPQAFLLADVKLGVGVRGTDGEGVEVRVLLLNSPLRKKGIKMGEVILKLNGKDVLTTGEWLRVAEAAIRAGEVRYTFVVRGKGGDERTVEVNVGG